MRMMCTLIIMSLLAGVSDLHARHYQLYDLGKAINVSVLTETYGTSINSEGKVGGYTQGGLWFTWDCRDGAIFPGGGFTGGWASPLYGPRAPYLDENGTLWMHPVNVHGQSLFVDKGKLYLRANSTNQLIDADSEWWSSNGGYSPRINGNQEVVGQVKRKDGQGTIKYLDLKSGAKHLIPVKGRTYVSDINEVGQIVGWCNVNSRIYGFIWQPSKGQDTWQSLGDFTPTSINDLGVIAGSENGRAVILEHGILRYLDDVVQISTDYSTEIESIEAISDINNSNDMVGWGKVGSLTKAVLIKGSEIK